LDERAPSADSPAWKRDAVRVARHSTRVRHLRLILPALCVGLVLTYALSATPPRIDQQFAQQFAGIEVNDDGVRLARPRYSGEDLSGRPFEVAANSAVKRGEGSELVDLENPEAETIGTDGLPTRVRARSGLYDETGKRLDLRDDVELTQGEGVNPLRIVTSAAEVDLEDQVITSTTGVEGRNASGTLRADRATVYQKEDRVILEGGVQITLEPKAADAPSGDAEPER
jgi:LPS export ABC transporter protein LptC